MCPHTSNKVVRLIALQEDIGIVEKKCTSHSPSKSSGINSVNSEGLYDVIGPIDSLISRVGIY